MRNLLLCALLCLGLAAGCGNKKRLQDFGSPTELTGTWRRNCLPLDRGGYVKEILEVGNSVANSAQEAYLDADCTKLSNEFRFGGTYALGEQRTKTVDFTLTYVEITLHNAGDVATYNNYKMCGAADWKIGESHDCPTEVKSLYQIYRLESTDTLYLGKVTTALDGTTPEKRPTEFDTTQVYNN